MIFIEYDPTWLVELARKQYPEETWLIESLSKCKRYCRESNGYYYFIDPVNANKPGSEWQFKTNYILEDEIEGELVLDIMGDLKVGGVEFIKQLTGDPHFLSKCEKNKIFVD